MLPEQTNKSISLSPEALKQFRNQFDSEEIGVDLWVVSECVRLMIDGCQEVLKFLPLVATLRSTNQVKITICISEVV